MILEMAPMEGITTYIYRNAVNRYFGGIDTYFSPFISVHQNKSLNFKEINDLKPENNKDITLIPQVMASNVEDFLNTGKQIIEMGYDHINFNFGCPSGTVTTKGKGAGVLLFPDELEKFLDGVFEKTNIKISVKTRIGYTDPSEWEAILNVYKKFPLEELIIHGRVREEFYKGTSRMELVVDSVAELCEKMKVSYNGDIFSLTDYERLFNRCPKLYACMLGRGIISNPALAKNIRGSEKSIFDGDKIINIEDFKKFNIEVMTEYEKIMSGNKNSLFRIKELWFYMSQIFTNPEKTLKKIQKCKTLREYEMLVLSMTQDEIVSYF